MTSEIRVNKINNRAGLGTITIADTGVVVNGIVTCTEVSGLNVLNIAGVSTFANTLDINGDIDVDGHTNLDNVSISGVVTATTYKGDGSQLTGIAVGGASSITFNDNVGLYFGAGNSNGRDLEIIHEPSNSVTSFKVEANDAQFSKRNGNKIARFSTTGVSYLYYNNNLRLETTSSGITLPTTVLVSSNNRINFRDANAYILHEQSTLKIQTAGSGGDIRLRTNSGGGDSGDIIFNGGSIGELLRAHGAGHVDVTNSLNVGAGVSVAGIVTASSYRGDGSQLTGISAGVAGIDTTGQSHLKLLNVNAGVVTFTNTSNPTPSATLPSGTGGHIYSFDNALNIVGGSGAGAGGLVFQEGGFTRWRIASGHFRPHSDSTVDIGTNSVRVRNIYADTLYGDGSNLSNLPASAPVGGASTNTVFFENDKEVAVNYQITSTKNAMTAGPVAINAGIAVTVPSGCAWTIV